MVRHLSTGSARCHHSHRDILTALFKRIGTSGLKRLAAHLQYFHLARFSKQPLASIFLRTQKSQHFCHIESWYKHYTFQSSLFPGSFYTRVHPWFSNSVRLMFIGLLQRCGMFFLLPKRGGDSSIYRVRLLKMKWCFRWSHIRILQAAEGGF